MAMEAILLTTPFRRRARVMERELQAWLDTGRRGPAPGGLVVPTFAYGVRVEHAGLCNWAVVATRLRGQ